MTQVDFYILSETQKYSREILACRIVEKAYSHGHRIYIQARDQSQGEQLDQLLWTFKQGSFLPHECITRQNSDEPGPIVIGWDEEPSVSCDVLVNLADNVPRFFGRFERVMEVVDDSEDGRQQARERYQFYRDRGYPLDTHNVG